MYLCTQGLVKMSQAKGSLEWEGLRSLAVEHDILMTYLHLFLCTPHRLLLVCSLLAHSPHYSHITFRTSFLTASVERPKLLFLGEMYHNILLGLYAISLCNRSLVSSDRCVIHLDEEFCLLVTVSLT